jgi:tetratricopeptide (TPR) repeat protein
VLAKALAVDPAKRWQTCSDFVRALRASARQAGLTTSGDVAAAEHAAPDEQPPAAAATAPAAPAATRAVREPEPTAAARPPTPAGGRRLLAAIAAGSVAAALAGGYVMLRPQPPATGDTGGAATGGAAMGGSATAPPAQASPRERAVGLQQRGEFAAAGDAYAAALAADPNELAAVLWDLQTQAADAGRVGDCVPLLERLERLYAASPAPRVKGISRWDVVNALAWYVATRPTADVAAGRRAEALAREGLALAGDDPQMRGPALDTLAAAAARAGDFTEAMRRVDEAIALTQDAAQRADFERHRSRYAANAAWSEP